MDSLTTMNHHCGRYEKFTNRRDFLKKAGAGFGLLALADLLQADGLLATEIESSRTLDPMTPRQPHYPPQAKSIIWLFMEGAPSSVDLFDPKPELTKRDGQRIEIDVFNGNPGPLMKSPFSFKQYGQSGAWVCEKYPNVAKHVDDFAFIKSLYSESNDHVPALYQINTGIPRPGFPSAGAWITYGLGSESQNLPGYVVLGNSQGVKGGPLNWSAGFLAFSGSSAPRKVPCRCAKNHPPTDTATPAKILPQPIFAIARSIFAAAIRRRPGKRQFLPIPRSVDSLDRCPTSSHRSPPTAELTRL